MNLNDKSENERCSRNCNVLNRSRGFVTLLKLFLGSPTPHIYQHQPYARCTLVVKDVNRVDFLDFVVILQLHQKVILALLSLNILKSEPNKTPPFKDGTLKLFLHVFGFARITRRTSKKRNSTQNHGQLKFKLAMTERVLKIPRRTKKYNLTMEHWRKQQRFFDSF